MDKKGIPSVTTMLQKAGITKLNDMQLATVDAIKKQTDILLLSPTGSGKTLAFLLPLVAMLKTDAKGVQALVLTPSRELAMQIESVFKSLGTGLKVNCFYGGHAIKSEENSLSEPPVLLIGTPGRIDDHVKRGNLNLSTVKILILDEFDKSLHLGFHTEMEYIIKRLSGLKQRILTSATSAVEIPDFVGISNLEEINYLSDNPSHAVLSICKVFSDDADKLSTLLELLSALGNASILVFLNHRDAVDRVGDYLTDHDVVHGVFHGGLDQDERERSLCKFRNGSVQILITTDLAARGLDIPEIKYVIQYHLPQTIDVFTHRNGRTARMHAEGQVYVIVAPEEKTPEFISELETQELPIGRTLPYQPEWITLYVGKGKKDKINKIDIVGFLCQKGKLEKADVGLIEVKDNFAYVAVKRLRVKNLLKNIAPEKLKGKRIKIEIAR